ncbi:hypothetical protein HMPREF0973_00384 [Prevotella veroralis F0319]|uniref:Uncharacterized protein n=1 Tax=Prevotella veroralis F0319 TaxID=649761 RepID=C9MLA8_9BACT|nr:hypothetical protein HMPREF0973_00384 [Prevotella veroralis F0319]
MRKKRPLVVEERLSSHQGNTSFKWKKISTTILTYLSRLSQTPHY